jgi:DNA ligase (NAD+)
VDDATKTKRIHTLLDKAWVAYDKGFPFMSDADFNTLAKKYNYTEFGSLPEVKAKHLYKMYSLQKVFDDDPEPSTMQGTTVSSPKLDGAAISLIYVDGTLVKGITRGRDGIEGEDITANVYPLVPNTINLDGEIQITGEVVCPKDIDNARNYASGAIRMKDMQEYKNRIPNLNFIAYNIQPFHSETYIDDMILVEELGITTILKDDLEELYRTDGEVFRINDNKVFNELGYTAKHPRGAYARKMREDVEIKETVLRNVIWGVGRTGKVTPVALFDTIVIDDANISQATLHNVGFIEEMKLEIGDTILVTRSGGIIPKVIGKL